MFKPISKFRLMFADNLFFAAAFLEKCRKHTAVLKPDPLL